MEKVTQLQLLFQQLLDQLDYPYVASIQVNNRNESSFVKIYKDSDTGKTNIEHTTVSEIF